MPLFSEKSYVIVIQNESLNAKLVIYSHSGDRDLVGNMFATGTQKIMTHYRTSWNWVTKNFPG